MATGLVHHPWRQLHCRTSADQAVVTAGSGDHLLEGNARSLADDDAVIGPPVCETTPFISRTFDLAELKDTKMCC